MEVRFKSTRILKISITVVTLWCKRIKVFGAAVTGLHISQCYVIQSKSNPWASCVHTLLGWEVWEEAELSPSECLSRDQITELLSSVWGLVHANADISLKLIFFPFSFKTILCTQPLFCRTHLHARNRNKYKCWNRHSVSNTWLVYVNTQTNINQSFRRNAQQANSLKWFC